MSASSSSSSSSEAPKLPYFHRTLSAEDQELLAANAGPKAITAEVSDTVEASSSSSSSSGGSAWNAAGSWEEKDCTRKCKALFLSIIQAEEAFASLASLGLVVISSNIDSSHSNITFTRGKISFLYEFALSLRFELTLPSASTTFTGSLKCEDLGNDIAPSEFEIGVEWQGGSPSGPCFAESKAVIQGKQLREALFALLKRFEESWRQSELERK